MFPIEDAASTSSRTPRRGLMDDDELCQVLTEKINKVRDQTYGRTDAFEKLNKDKYHFKASTLSNLK